VVPNPPTPEPDVPVVPVVSTDTIDAFTTAVNANMRPVYLETARKLDAGELATAEAMIADETGRFDSMFDKATQPLANREQRETNTGGPWTPKRAADYRRKIAGER
jgi:hypothetical protein